MQLQTGIQVGERIGDQRAILTGDAPCTTGSRKVNAKQCTSLDSTGDSCVIDQSSRLTLDAIRTVRRGASMTTAESQTARWLNHVRSVWNERAADWDRMSEVNALSPERTADIARLAVELDLHHGSRLLDAGCGTGQWAIAFAQLGCQVTAQDLAPAMVDRARVHAQDRGVTIDFREDDLTSLPDPRATFDAIHAQVVLHFVRDVPAALREFRRVLKPGGRLWASVPGALSPIYNRSWRRFVDPDNVGTSFMVPWELEALLREGGWTVVEQWGEYGDSMNTVTNPLRDAVRGAPVALQQAAATTWGFIAR
jgi:2-polyprenyl-3-methyl-5-hydroxy-6-metoxy-1,4-benzoquinol methylase